MPGTPRRRTPSRVRRTIHLPHRLPTGRPGISARRDNWCAKPAPFPPDGGAHTDGSSENEAADPPSLLYDSWFQHGDAVAGPSALASTVSALPRSLAEYDESWHASLSQAVERVILLPGQALVVEADTAVQVLSLGLAAFGRRVMISDQCRLNVVTQETTYEHDPESVRGTKRSLPDVRSGSRRRTRPTLIRLEQWHYVAQYTDRALNVTMQTHFDRWWKPA